jgi:HK97 gp10 family phage protein
MSVTVNLNISGAKEFEQALNRFDNEMKNQVQTKFSEWAGVVQREAERLVPVRTGYLRSTIYAKAKEWQLEIGAEATYAAAVEFGTRSMQAKPYLNPAVENHLPELERVLLEALDTAKMEAGL